MRLLTGSIRLAALGALLLASAGAPGCAAGTPPGSDQTGSGDGSGGAIAAGGGDAPAPGPVSPAPVPPLGSRCTLGPTLHDIDCSHQTTTIAGRVVLWQTPLGIPPLGGWPVVIIYQGSLLSPDGSSLLAPHGMWQVTAGDGATDGIFADYVLTQLTTQTTVIERLLDGGYAVLTPTADSAGFAWDTNLPPWLFDWPPAPDNQFLDALFSVIATGQLGPLSTTRWYATGVSSGGYMTSRMAVSYDGRFRALAVAAGSYATCAGGGACLVPALPADHPPTLFLHGLNDPLVPIAQMYAYFDALTAIGRDTKALVDANTKHGWIPQAPDAILSWFGSHP